MSFFRRMKERLLKSASQIDDGVSALIDQGDATSETPAAVPKEQIGLTSRVRDASAAGATKTEEKRRILDDAMLEELEELLIAADLGVETAMRVSANIAATKMGMRISGTEIKQLLAKEVAEILEPVAHPLLLMKDKKPQVILVVGVNGSGKTTTIGKLASQLKASGRQVMIAAGDTFRAAAVAQRLFRRADHAAPPDEADLVPAYRAVRGRVARDDGAQLRPVDGIHPQVGECDRGEGRPQRGRRQHLVRAPRLAELEHAAAKERAAARDNVHVARRHDLGVREDLGAQREPVR